MELGPDERRGITELNGEGEVASGIALQRSGSNALDVIDNVKQRLAALMPSLPEGTKIVPLASERMPDQRPNDLRCRLHAARVPVLETGQRKPVTLRHLLDHMGRGHAREVGAARGRRERKAEADQVVRRVADDGLVEVPDLDDMTLGVRKRPEVAEMTITADPHRRPGRQAPLAARLQPIIEVARAAANEGMGRARHLHVAPGREDRKAFGRVRRVVLGHGLSRLRDMIARECFHPAGGTTMRGEDPRSEEGRDADAKQGAKGLRLAQCCSAATLDVPQHRRHLAGEVTGQEPQRPVPLREPAARFAVQVNAPQGRPHGIGSTGQQSGDEAGQDVARARGGQADTAAFVQPSGAVRADDPALGSLHDHEGPQQLRCGMGGDERIGLDVLAAFLQQLRHLSRMRGDNTASSAGPDSASMRPKAT